MVKIRFIPFYMLLVIINKRVTINIYSQNLLGQELQADTETCAQYHLPFAIIYTCFLSRTLASRILPNYQSFDGSTFLCFIF